MEAYILARRDELTGRSPTSGGGGGGSKVEEPAAAPKGFA